MKASVLCGLCGCLMLQAASLNGSAKLTVKASPAAALAPAFVRVRATIEADDDNRALIIVAESDEFYRSSEIPLDGRRAPRVSVVEFPSLPMGLYEVTGILVGTRGQRATASQRVNVVFGGGTVR